MRRSLFASAAAAALVVPVLVFAAFPSPSDLFQALRMRSKPMDASFEVHASYQNVYVSLWSKGASEGRDLPSIQSSLKMTLDISAPQGTVRTKMQMRIVHQTLYFFVDGVTGNAENEFGRLAAQAAGKKWFSVSLKDLPAQDNPFEGMTDDEKSALIGKIVNAAFLLMSSPAANGKWTYSLTLHPAATESLQRLSLDNPSSSPMFDTQNQMQDFAAIVRALNFHALFTADSNDEVQSMKLYAALDQDGLHFVVLGTATVRSKPLTVDVPAGAVSLGEQLNDWGAMPTMPAVNENTVPVPLPDETMPAPEPTMFSSSSNSSALDGCDGLSAAERLQGMRRGECGGGRPSPRSFRP